MDDFGTVNVNITTLSDYNVNTKFRPTNVVDYSQWADIKVTKTLDAFFKVSALNSNFGYIIHKEGNEAKVLYTSHDQKLFISDYMVMDSATFVTNDITKNRIIGIGESAKNMYYENQKWNVYSRYTMS
jgi:hypothetical protein